MGLLSGAYSPPGPAPRAGTQTSTSGTSSHAPAVGTYGSSAYSGRTAGQGAYQPVGQSSPSNYFGYSADAAERNIALRNQQTLSDAYNAIMGANAVQLAGFQGNVDQANLRLGHNGAIYANDQTALRNAYNENMALANIDTMSNAVDRQGIPRDLAYLNSIWGNDFAKYLADYAYTNNQKDWAWQDRWLADATVEGANADRAQQIREALATGGGGFTEGIRYDTGANRRDLELGWRQGKQNFDQTMGGILHNQQGLDQTLSRNQIEHDQAVAQKQQQSQHLDLDAAKIGVSKDALVKQYNQQLELLGLQNVIKIGDLLAAIKEGNAGALAIREAAMAAAVAAGQAG